ncbi:hypothetical protein KW784_01375 [Candidatus Parcubacteria bacterium]|nr:hypothetical protein [Candidatus Parcubacteria bacterium]
MTPIKNTLFSLAIVSLALAATASANEIQVRGNDDRLGEIRGTVQVKLGDRDDRNDDRSASSTASSTEKRMEKQDKLSRRMVEHAGKILLATIERLEKIATRLDSRIAKVKTAGGSTVASEGFLAEARVHLSEAKAEMAAFSSIDISGSKLSENLAKVRSAASTIKEHLRLAHQALAKATAALKPGRSTNEGHATSTATSTHQ